MYLYLKKSFVVYLCAGLVAYGVRIPKAKAMDPVTISILAPILMPYAIKAAKYSVRGLIRTVPGWINAGKQLFNILRLPLGILQLLLGWPFGLAGYGAENLFLGFIAPFMLIKEILTMPLYFFGLA